MSGQPTASSHQLKKKKAKGCRLSAQGFTFIEMAVVITIIGLLTGGVLMGQSLLVEQRVRGILTDATSYRHALTLFKSKYGELPGDFSTAVRVWGKADGNADLTTNCAAPATDASDGKTTCNGDGDGLIEAASFESFRAWQQLAAAEMVIGKFTGIYATGNIRYAIPGTNSPLTAVKNTTFFLDSFGTLSADASRFDGDYDNVLVYGTTTTNSYPTAAAISGKQAYSLDNKADDGLPGLGDMRGWNNTAQANCSTTNVPSTAKYDKDYTSPSCGLFFLNSFAAESTQ